MSAIYSNAEEVEEIAKDLIADHYPEIAGNPLVKIIYRFEDPARNKNGKVVMGECKRMTGLNSYLYHDGHDFDPGTDPFFLILIAYTVWRKLSEKQREALVDHELAHIGCERDEEGNTRLSINAHDVEEFESVVRRHGMWKTDLQRFAEAVEETVLPGLFDGETRVTIEHGDSVATITGERVSA